MHLRLELPGRGRIGVLTGGVSRERNPSLQSGESASDSLRRQGYDVRVIDTSNELIAGLPHVDVAFLAIAGQYGEDGKLQGLLETFGIPYTGSGVLASALGMHKPTAKTVVAASGVTVCPEVRIDPAQPVHEAARLIADLLGLPVIIKPESEGSSLGIEVGHSVAEVAEVLRRAGADGARLMAEPFRSGRNVTVGVLDLDGGPVGLPPLEIKTPQEFFDHPAKQTAALRSFQCPAEFPAGLNERLSALAVVAHRALGCSGYSRSDFIVAEDGEACFLEVNTLPSLKPTATLATMCATIGVDYDRMIRCILNSALEQSAYRA
ncbi:D-alanine--D-alanine ligase family protein [Longimicrobium terrae]|uniref:D-alanine--D-alanine ligase n=1 Tax=Longimicrobium terrae TaxID=1639882 RepID=A0A841H1F0_9BACT|nr:D-alanine--D-alanine ligase [Longimicrobium terrae]MBB4637432.1 D-alanine-D-alanine ligase [Longimicrobium terrae]MBB6071830.1 D-alanine-D-alanine ligase [Longimicrobium terrae]NNC30379.1 D-alanine--D-alanine ligase [Longimicrobium terrae]